MDNSTLNHITWGEIVTVVIVLAVQTIGLGKFLLGRIDAAASEGRRERSTLIADLHSRINDVREQYVRRDDFQAHIDRMEKTLDRIALEQKEHAAQQRNLALQLNKRIDDVLASIAGLSASLARPSWPPEKPGR